MVRYLLIILVLCSCSTRKKRVDATKQASEQSVALEESTDRQSNTSTAVVSTGITAYDFREFLGQFTLNYDGQMGEGFRFYMNETENGWEAGAEGKGTATAETETRQINSRIEVNWQEKFDSLSISNEKRFSEYESRMNSLESRKNIDKKSTGLQFGAYVAGTILLILFILLAWLNWKLRNLNKTVQSFLNFKTLLKGG